MRAAARRFVWVYVVLWCAPFPLSMIPRVDPSSNVLENMTRAAAAALGGAIGVEADASPMSSDGMIFWLKALLFAIVAAAVSLARTVACLRSGREAPPFLAAPFRVYLRWYLAWQMLLYGWVKLLGLQFESPDTLRLLDPLGDLFPMELLWGFMGSSPAYAAFAGSAEVLGGLLLLFRRTTLLGALVVAAVMSNVVVLDFCFDVPVKLIALHLFAFSLLLIAPDVPRLANFFLRNRATEPEPLPRTPTSRARLLVKALALVVVLGTTLPISQLYVWSYMIPGLEPDPLEGVFLREPPPSADRDVFRIRVARSGNDLVFVVERWDRSRRFYAAARDDDSLTLTRRNATEAAGVLRVTPLDGGAKVAIDGTLEGEPVSATLRRLGPEDFRLFNTPFQWVSDTPRNRG